MLAKLSKQGIEANGIYEIMLNASKCTRQGKLVFMKTIYYSYEK